MKRRFVVPFLAALCILIPLTAHAGQWKTKEVKWSKSNVGAPFNGTGIYVRDTAYTVVDGEGRDTTAWFNLDDADPILRGVVAPGISEVQAPVSTGALSSFANDTTVVAYLVFQSDTAAAPTATLSSCTWIIDGRVGGFGATTTLARGWVKADSALVNGAAGGTLIIGDESFAIPIRTISPYGNIRRWGELRARQIAATGILSAVRVFLRYYSND